MIRVPLYHDTIPHPVLAKYKAGKVLLMPAPRGLVSSPAAPCVRSFELAGVPNASAKILSKTNNKLTNLKAAFEALQLFKPLETRGGKAKNPGAKTEAAV